MSKDPLLALFAFIALLLVFLMGIFASAYGQGQYEKGFAAGKNSVTIPVTPPPKPACTPRAALQWWTDTQDLTEIRRKLCNARTL